MTTHEHWESVYRQKSPDAVSWFRPRLDRSLALIAQAGLNPGAHIADIGGGASTLVDDLLALGTVKVSVADLSASALEHSKRRLGDTANKVSWVVGDATTRLFGDTSVDLWHDRAVFHFLTEPGQRAAYLEHMARALRPSSQGAHVLLATFGPDGPERCSGLPVVRYSAAALAETVGHGFELVAEDAELHTTPWGSSQAFTYALLRRRDP